MTVVMGVLNATPDSFSDGGLHLEPEAAIAHGRMLVREGADVVDVGGESTRPGAQRVPARVEQDRVLPVIGALSALGVIVSVDTMNAGTARAAVAAGAAIVNDVSGGLADPGMLEAVADTDAEIVLGHWRGPSADMYARASYEDVAAEVARELRERLDEAVAAGIPADRVILDPGIGFGKTPRQSWATLAGLERMLGLGARVLVGTSRKRFLEDALGGGASPARRDLATAVTSALAARAGVWGVRVHDVAATRDALAVEREWRL